MAIRSAGDTSYLCLGEACASTRYMETTMPEATQPLVGADPKCPFCIHMKIVYERRRQAIAQTENLKSLTVKTVEAILCSHPDES